MFLSDERARDAYKSFVRKRRIFGFSRNVQGLKSFKVTQEETKAFNNSFLGIKNVLLDEIVGSVDKFESFDKNFIPLNSIIEDRWCRIYKEVMGDANLPPVNLYKLRDEYFVYDGNHRISVAKFMNYKFIEAEVTEFFASGDSEEDVVHKERFVFEKETGLEGIIITKAGQYKRLIRNIWDFKDDCRSVQMVNFNLAAKEWYEKLYRPIREILRNNKIEIEGKSEGDLFLGYLDHKYYLSEYRKYNVGYTFALIDFINHLKVKSGELGITSFNMNRNFITSFRNLYDFDKKVFYKLEYQEKFGMLRSFSGRKFSRENHVIGEIELYRKLNSIGSFKDSMTLWFTNVYANYYELFTENSQVLGDIPFFEDDQEIIEDIIKYSREYRKREGRLLTNQEIIYKYLLDVYLPITSILKSRKVEEEREEYYLDRSHKYLYYLRYAGELKFIDFERRYISHGEAGISTLIASAFNRKRNKGDMFRDIKKLLIYYSPTKEAGEKQVEKFYEVIEKYGGSDNYRAIHRLRESLIGTMEEEYEIDWVTDILQKDLEALSKRQEIIINYNTKRVFKYVKGVWDKYTLIDYYTAFIPLNIKREEGGIVETALEYMKRDFRY